MKLSRRNVKIAIVGVLAVLVFAAIFVWQFTFTMNAVQRVSIGMTEAEVEAKLGRPDHRDPIPNNTVNLWWFAADGMIAIKIDASGIVVEKDTVKYETWYERWYHVFGWPL